MREQFRTRFDARDISKQERNSTRPRGRNSADGSIESDRCRQARNAPEVLRSGERHAKSANAARRTSPQLRFRQRRTDDKRYSGYRTAQWERVAGVFVRVRHVSERARDQETTLLRMRSEPWRCREMLSFCSPGWPCGWHVVVRIDKASRFLVFFL